MNPYQVLIRPVASEKSVSMRDKENKYTFVVNTKANKGDIKKAIESVFDVKVIAVNTNTLPGKTKRRGATTFKQSKRKKAIVQLAKDQKIKLFDDQ